MQARRRSGPAAKRPDKVVVQKPAAKLAPKTVAMLRDATPEQREQAIKIASKLLARKATRAPTKGWLG
jgi:hypothetical protein